MTKFEHLSPGEQLKCFTHDSFPQTVINAGMVVPMSFRDIEKMPKPLLDAAYDKWLSNQKLGKPALVLLDLPVSIFPSSDRTTVDIRAKRKVVRDALPTPSPPATPNPTATETRAFNDPIDAELDSPSNAVETGFQRTRTPGNTETSVAGKIPSSRGTPSGSREDDFLELEIDPPTSSPRTGSGFRLFTELWNQSHLQDSEPTRSITQPTTPLFGANNGTDSPVDIELDFGDESEVEHRLSPAGVAVHMESRVALPHPVNRLPSPMTPAKVITDTDARPLLSAGGLPVIRTTRTRNVIQVRGRLPTLLAPITTSPTRGKKRSRAVVEDESPTKMRDGTHRKVKPKPRPKAKAAGSSREAESNSMDSPLQTDPYNRAGEERSKRRRM